MKAIIESLNKVLESRVRLAIMSVLVVNDSMDFNALKHLLRVTDGNLAAHVAVLERAGYVRVTKQFVARKTQTTYEATSAGKNAFAAHVDGLERLIKSARE